MGDTTQPMTAFQVAASLDDVAAFQQNFSFVRYAMQITIAITTVGSYDDANVQRIITIIIHNFFENCKYFSVSVVK